MIASGAGYKKPVMKLCEEFTKESGIKVEMIFGNMQTVSMQVKQSGQVGLLIGDKSFLENSALGVSYEKYTLLGMGKLVLAYSKSLDLKNTEELTENKVMKVALPDTQKAIYGKAAMQYLQSEGTWDLLQDKIILTSTVPMASSYLMSEEVDCSFINLTDAIGIQDKIGGYILLEQGYTPIEIVAGTVSGFENNKGVKQFVTYLESDQVKKNLALFGL
jgi:molybdate transport system substrate-binding protein